MLFENQELKFNKCIVDSSISDYEVGFTVTMRYDDRCKNKHNTFSIRGSTVRMYGCLHDLIVEHFPEFAHLIKWHLCSDDGPLHYITNTTYWAKQGNLENARICAVWEDATLEDLMDEEKLKSRLPALLEEFRETMVLAGFKVQ